MADAVALVGLLFVAFAGGAFGAALGAYPAFALSGLVVVAGEASRVVGGVSPAGGPLPAVPGATGLVASVALGPAFGPHVAFGGGAAAAAYAARKGYLDTGFAYHEAKHVTTALGTRPDVLLVGGVFGVLGYWIAQLSVRFALPWDPVAASVVLSAVLHRIVFGYPLFGRLGRGILDMTPYERGDRRMAPGGGNAGEQAGALSGRFVVEPWLPAQYEWANVAVLGSEGSVYDSVDRIQPDIITLGHDQRWDADALREDLAEHGFPDVEVVEIGPWEGEGIHSSSTVREAVRRREGAEAMESVVDSVEDR